MHADTVNLFEPKTVPLDKLPLDDDLKELIGGTALDIAVLLLIQIARELKKEQACS